MIFDAVRRFLGVGGSSSSNDNVKEIQPQPPISIFNNGQIVPFNGEQQMPPDISQIESEIAQVHRFMEQQMRTMMGSFGFSFGNPFSGFGIGFEDDSHGPFGSQPFTGDLPYFPNMPAGPEAGPPVLDPRDEVLKPQFRSKSSTKWTGQDQILDDRLNNEGIGSILEDLRPPNGMQERNDPVAGSLSPFFGSDMFNGLFGGVLQPGRESSSVMSSSTVTIYSNVNGHKSMEKIVRLPDGRIERTVITDDANPQQ